MKLIQKIIENMYSWLKQITSRQNFLSGKSTTKLQTTSVPAVHKLCRCVMPYNPVNRLTHPPSNCASILKVHYQIIPSGCDSAFNAYKTNVAHKIQHTNFNVAFNIPNLHRLQAYAATSFHNQYRSTRCLHINILNYTKKSITSELAAIDAGRIIHRYTILYA